MENKILSTKINSYKLKMLVFQGIAEWKTDGLILTFCPSPLRWAQRQTTLWKSSRVCVLGTYWNGLIFDFWKLFSLVITASRSENNVISITVIFDRDVLIWLFPLLDYLWSDTYIQSQKQSETLFPVAYLVFELYSSALGF